MARYRKPVVIVVTSRTARTRQVNNPYSTSWVTLVYRDGSKVEHKTRRIARIDLKAQPPHSECIQFSSGDRQTPGSFRVWFRDSESRAFSLECLE